MLHIIRLGLFVFLFLQTTSAFEDADVRFEIEKTGHKRLIIKAFERSRRIFAQAVDQNFQSHLTFGQHILSREGSGFKLTYRGSDQTSLNFLVDEDGNISLSDIRGSKPGYGKKTPIRDGKVF